MSKKPYFLSGKEKEKKRFPVFNAATEGVPVSSKKTYVICNPYCGCHYFRPDKGEKYCARGFDI